jgi:hypothetical protein
VCRESAAGDGAFGGGELVGDVADGFAAFGEATHDFVLFGDREVFEAHAVAGYGAFDGDLVQVVGDVGWAVTRDSGMPQHSLTRREQATPTPERTVESVKQDVTELKEHAHR